MGNGCSNSLILVILCMDSWTMDIVNLTNENVRLWYFLNVKVENIPFFHYIGKEFLFSSCKCMIYKYNFQPDVMLKWIYIDEINSFHIKFYLKYIVFLIPFPFVLLIYIFFLHWNSKKTLFWFDVTRACFGQALFSNFSRMIIIIRRACHQAPLYLKLK